MRSEGSDTGKGAKSALLKNSGEAQDLSNEYSNNAEQLYGSLAPELKAEAVSPSGYSPSDLAAMRTAAMQTAGGTQAGATGAGRLYAARTKNSGGIGDAIASSARTAGEELGRESVGIEAQNAKLKQQQRQAGLSGLESLNSTEMGAGLSALGLSNSALNAENQAPNFWQQYLLTAAGNANKAASMAGGE